MATPLALLYLFIFFLVGDWVQSDLFICDFNSKPSNCTDSLDPSKSQWWPSNQTAWSSLLQHQHQYSQLSWKQSNIQLYRNGKPLVSSMLISCNFGCCYKFTSFAITGDSIIGDYSEFSTIACFLWTPTLMFQWYTQKILQTLFVSSEMVLYKSVKHLLVSNPLRLPILIRILKNLSSL